MNPTSQLIARLRRAGVADRQIAVVLGWSWGNLRVRLSRDKAAGVDYPSQIPTHSRRAQATLALLAANETRSRLSVDDAVFLITEGETPRQMYDLAVQLIGQRLVRADDVSWLTDRIAFLPEADRLAA